MCSRGAQAPIQHCFLTEFVFEVGIGTLVLARGATQHYLSASSFLIDVFCLGIKDVMFKSFESEEFETYMERDGSRLAHDCRRCRPTRASCCAISPAWSKSIGFAPHRDFAAVEPLFGDVNADASDAVFQFGQDGKPVDIPGPSDTAAATRQRIAQLQKYLGDRGFETAA